MGIELISQRREQIMSLAARYGASHIRVFGSFARGTADDRSDIDFLVDLAPGRSLFDLGGFLYELQQLLGRNVDVVTTAGLRPRIRDRVLSEAVELRETTGKGCSIFRRRLRISKNTPLAEKTHLETRSLFKPGFCIIF